MTHADSGTIEKSGGGTRLPRAKRSEESLLAPRIAAEIKANGYKVSDGMIFH